MAAQFRQKYGLHMNDDNSFATPEFTQKRNEIHPNQSYEVTIEGESVIVLGSSLKPMRSKKGYYRLLYHEKLYVLHTSEIREVDRTENDVVSGGLDKTTAGGGVAPGDDTDEDTTEIPTQNTSNFLGQKPSFPTFMQSYSVKLNNTWLTLPSTAVNPSREMPGFYNVTYQGQIFNVTAVNVIPVNNTQSGHQHTQHYPSYTKPQTHAHSVPHRHHARQELVQNPPQHGYQTAGYHQQYTDTNRNSVTNTVTKNVTNQVTTVPTVPPIRKHTRSGSVSRPIHPVGSSAVNSVQPALPTYQAFRPVNPLPQVTPVFSTTPQGTNTIGRGAVSVPPAPHTADINRQVAPAAAPKTVPIIEKVTEDISNLTVNPRRTRPIRRESYTVEKPTEMGKVRVLVGGAWRTIEKKHLKPSKKKPETFIARVDDRSVRLKESQIREYKGEDEEEVKGGQGELYQVFIDGNYVTIPAENIEDAPKKIGFKIVTSNGITQLVHTNFIFPMEETEDGLQPAIPDFYKVYLTPEGVTVPKENIKPDETLYNTFMVLWNNIIYKLSAENLTPILPNDKENLVTEEKPEPEKTEKPRKRTLMDPTIATTARMKTKSPVKPTKKPTQKPRSPKFTVTKPAVRVIPERPKGVFPAKESGDEETPVKQPPQNKECEAVKESKTSLRGGESERDLCSRSPYESPVSWDKRLRRTTGQKKKAQNLRPRWTFTTANRSYNVKSKKLLYKKLMVPSEKAEGKYQLYGTSMLGDQNEKSSLAKFLNQQKSTTVESPSSEMKPKSNIEGRTSVAASESIAIDSTIENSLVDSSRSRTTTTEMPYISTHGDPKALLATTPGIPVLQDHRILVGPDARANRDWVRTLRAV